MDMDHLASQFSGVMRGAAEAGVELPPQLPGMAKIGGLHVPVADSSVYLGTDEGHDSPNWQSLSMYVPDEHGNVFNLHAGKGEFGGNVRRGAEHVEFHSPEAFADLYGQIGPPEGKFPEWNSELLDMFHGTRQRMGIGPGMSRGALVSPDSALLAEHVVDHRTGEVSDLAMSVHQAQTEWRKDYERRQHEARQRKEGL